MALQRAGHVARDPVGVRRHLDETQRAIVAAKLANCGWGGNRKSDQAANLPLDNCFLDLEPSDDFIGAEAERADLEAATELEYVRQAPPITQSEAADMLNVSECSVRSARRILDDGAPWGGHPLGQSVAVLIKR